MTKSVRENWPRARRHALLAALLALAAAAALLAGGCRSVRGWWVRRQASRPPYSIVRPPIAYEVIRDSPGVLILDLRTPQEFFGAIGHLRNAVNIPLARLPYRLIEISSFRGETFLVYCDTQPCAEAGMAVLLSSGFDNGILIEGGIDAWVRYGFKTFLPAGSIGRVRPERVPGLTPGKPTELQVEPPPPANPPPAEKPPAGAR
jgi:rhodanese-related sulfurtransferase